MRTAARLSALAAFLVAGAALADDAKPADKDRPVTDAEFVKKAASGGLFEVKSSELAKTNATAAEVKKFAAEMIADHSKANKELAAAAKKAGLEVPKALTEHDQKLLDKVKAAKGAGFDKAYMDAQVKAHEAAVKLFENGSKNLTDAGLKAFAEKTLPTIKEHYKHAKHHGDHDHDDKKGSGK